MEIIINDKWMLKTDELNIILCRVSQKKEGGTGWRVVGYFQKMEDLFDRLFDEGVYDSNSTSLKALKMDIKKMRDEIVVASEGISLVEKSSLKRLKAS